MADGGDVLFVRRYKDSSQQDDEEVDDMWDDTALVQAYDRAVSLAKEEVVRRMGLSNTSETESVSSKDRGGGGKRKKKKKKHGKKEWHIGFPCCATYSKDGLIYEATVQKIFYDKGTCVIRYIGYNNEEEHYLKQLLPSKGKSARKVQIEQAQLDEDHKDGLLENQYINFTHDTARMDCVEERSGKMSHKFKYRHIPKTTQNNLEADYSTDHRVPGIVEDRSGTNWYYPPPYPAMFTGGIYAPFPTVGLPTMPVPPPPPIHLTSGFPEGDSEALSAMLMAWYMSGFHTGYYHGLRQIRNKPQAADDFLRQDKNPRKKKSR